VVAVSPIVGGEVLKGPTAAFMEYAQLPCDAGGVARFYEGLLDGMVADETLRGSHPRSLRIDTRMDDASSRARVAAQTLAFARETAMPLTPRCDACADRNSLFGRLSRTRAWSSLARRLCLRLRLAPRAERAECAVDDAFEERLAVVCVRQRTLGDVDAEERAQ